MRSACAAGLCFWATTAAANPSMSSDFGRMTGWLSHELAQGLAFNAGSTFDPPHEVVSRRLQPDISAGVGKMPLNKKKFPEPETPALRDMDASAMFPSAVLFPNLAMHLRAGLPGRMDFSIRIANMTTPSGYHISPTATGQGQSNSIGVGLRRHFFGGPDRPMLGLGANFNHVYGKFFMHSKFNVDNIQGFSTDSDVNGELAWNVSSFGLSAVLSHGYRGWTPFFGYGYNYATGSVRARLEARPNTPLIARIAGESSEHPEQNQGRLIVGLEMDRPWMHFFANGEVKAMGTHAMESWIVHLGAALPFEIGFRGFAKRDSQQDRVASAQEYGDYGLPRREADSGKRKAAPVRPYLPAAASFEGQQELLFIQ
ncbi:MAG TPA: hypothetical protein DEB40_02770 [Elusimicrobia bacterium]|nr:hypothetical protein [Elusimicrobiota bacterium]HBT60653.1 hypothetical protein [Elusimicrobiota bacterium]